MHAAEPAAGRWRARITAALQPGAAARAGIASVLLHVALGAVLWHFEWLPAPSRLSEPVVVPVALRALPAVPPRRPAVPPAPSSAPPPEADIEPAATATPPQPTEPATPTPEPPPAVPAAPEPPATQSPEQPAEAQAIDPAPAAADASSATEPPAADPLRDDTPPSPEERLEAARLEAVARMAADIAEAAAGPDFSDDPAIDEGAELTDGSDAPYGEGTSIFEAAAELRRRGGGLLTHGRTRSRIGQRVSQLCNDLTGGFSLFGIVNVCADAPARADLFGHLRPEYMESLPLCTAEEELQIEVEDTGAGAVADFSCVLVPRAERAAFYGRYDPELAGWLPAESEEDGSDGDSGVSSTR